MNLGFFACYFYSYEILVVFSARKFYTCSWLNNFSVWSAWPIAVLCNVNCFSRGLSWFMSRICLCIFQQKNFCFLFDLFHCSVVDLIVNMQDKELTVIIVECFDPLPWLLQSVYVAYVCGGGIYYRINSFVRQWNLVILPLFIPANFVARGEFGIWDVTLNPPQPCLGTANPGMH